MLTQFRNSSSSTVNGVGRRAESGFVAQSRFIRFPPFGSWFNEECSFDRPSENLETRRHSRVFQASIFRMLRKAGRLTVEGVDKVGSSVSGLLQGSRPSTVSGAIRTARVNSVNRVTGAGPLSHVGKEPEKRSLLAMARVFPFIAYVNSLISVPTSLMVIVGSAARV